MTESDNLGHGSRGACVDSRVSRRQEEAPFSWDQDTSAVVFGGAAMLVGFHVGAAAFLSERFETERAGVAGNSAGCLAALTLAADLPHTTAEAFHRHACCVWNEERLRGLLRSPEQRVRDATRIFAPLEDLILESDATGRLIVGVTALTRRGPAWTALRSPFGNLEDLARAMSASCCIWPFSRYPAVWLTSRQVWAADGILTSTFPRTPSSSRATVTVSVVPTGATIEPRVRFPRAWLFNPEGPERWQLLLRAGYSAALEAAGECLKTGLVPRPMALSRLLELHRELGATVAHGDEDHEVRPLMD